MLFQSKSPPSIALFDPEWWKIAIALFIALLTQSTLLARLSFHGGVLSPALLLVLWYAMHAGATRGAFLGLIVGACEDALAATGTAWTFADAVAGALSGAIARALPNDSPWIAAPIVVPLTIARYVVFLFMLHIEHGPFQPAAHWATALCQSALNCLAAIIAFLLASRLDLPHVGR